MAKVKKEAKEADNKGEAKVKAASKGGGLAVKVRTGLFMLFFWFCPFSFYPPRLFFASGCCRLLLRSLPTGVTARARR